MRPEKVETYSMEHSEQTGVPIKGVEGLVTTPAMEGRGGRRVVGDDTPVVTVKVD